MENQSKAWLCFVFVVYALSWIIISHAFAGENVQVSARMITYSCSSVSNKTADIKIHVSNVNAPEGAILQVQYAWQGVEAGGPQSKVLEHYDARSVDVKKNEMTQDWEVEILKPVWDRGSAYRTLQKLEFSLVLLPGENQEAFSLGSFMTEDLSLLRSSCYQSESQLPPFETISIYPAVLTHVLSEDL